MNKKFKKYLIWAVVVAATCCGYILFEPILSFHRPDYRTYKQYMWLFKDSIIPEIDTSLSYSFTTKRDVYNNLHYKGSRYNIIVWEFKYLKGINPKNNISIDNYLSIDPQKLIPGETLNSGSYAEIHIKKDFLIDSPLNVNIDEYSKIDSCFEGSNYTGFYGLINKMSLSNKVDENQVIFNYPKGPTPTLFLAYGGRSGFFLIIIYSRQLSNTKQLIDDNLIYIFNLK